MKTDVKIFKNQDVKNKLFIAVSEIIIEADEWNENIEFTCRATHNSKIINETISKCKDQMSKSKPLMHLETPPLTSILTESQVTASCVVESAYDVTVSWWTDKGAEMPTSQKKRVDQKYVSNLTLPIEQWKQRQSITCRAEHPCLLTQEKTASITEVPLKKTPTVVIRRNLPDVPKRDSATLECFAIDLPSGELAITFQANDVTISELQYVNLPSNMHTLTALFTVTKAHQNKNNRFTCQVQQSHSSLWKSIPTGNLFDDPFVEPLVVPSINKPGSTVLKLVCSGTGFNPEIKWLPSSVAAASSKLLMQTDGRFKVSSEISVPQQEWNNIFTCQVSEQGSLKSVQQNTSICAVIPASAQKAQVYLFKPAFNVMRSDNQVSVTCLLLGQNLNHFSITWRVGRDIDAEGVTTQGPKDLGNGTQSIQSVKYIQAATWNAYINVSCEVKHLCSNEKQQKTVSRTKDVKRPTIQIFRPSDGELTGSKTLTLLCLISGFSPADISVHWQRNGLWLSASDFINGPVGSRSGGHDHFMQSTLILPATGNENDNYSCVVFQESNMNSNIYASVVQTPPSVVLLQGQGELVCLVSGYSPFAINITWFLGGVIAPNKNTTTGPAKDSAGKFMVKSHLSVSEWAPGTAYTCEVQHITGTVTRTISKAEFIEESLYFNENKSDYSTPDQVEETWKMACAFIAFFIISLIYGCTVTFIKVKAE